MLELVRVNANENATAVLPKSPTDGLVMGLARTNEELEAIQRLRFKVFTEEMNAVFPEAVDGLDHKTQFGFSARCSNRPSRQASRVPASTFCWPVPSLRLLWRI